MAKRIIFINVRCNSTKKHFTWSSCYRHKSKLKLGRGGISGVVPIRSKNTQV